MKIWSFALLLLGVATQSNAEGGCPPGQYPYETPQARQCVPIPGGGNTSSAPSEVYEDRWGATAVDPNTGNIGVAVGEKSKRKATNLAMARCIEGGSKGCVVRSTFYNQCIAFAEGDGFRASATAANKDEAQSRAIAKCAGDESATCTVTWSDCSLPERVR